MNIALRFAASSVLVASATAVAQQVPVHELSAPEARSSDNYLRILGIKHLPSNRLLVDDAGRRRLWLLESDLKSGTIVIDSTQGTSNSYPTVPAPLIPYLGDSSLFVDGSSMSLLVIDPNGKIARVMAAPRPQDLRFLMNSPAFVDDKGRLLYRAPMRISMNMATNGPTVPGDKKAVPQLPAPPDSAAIVRTDFDTRQVDTIGRVKLPNGSRPSISQGANGQMQVKTIINPLVVNDEWAVLSDGTLAFVRGHDYHVDLMHPDGSTSSSPKLPFDWKRLTDEDKQKLVDSARTANEEAAAKAAAAAKDPANIAREQQMAAEVQKMAGAMGGGGMAGGGGGGQVVVMRAGGGGGGGGGDVAVAKSGDGAMTFGGPGGMSMGAMTTEYAPLNEIADYYPAIRPGAAKADADGYLWVLPTTSAQSKNGELVYDVVNNKGVLTERVRIPQGRSIAGFGKGGIVYLMSGNMTDGFYLERARIIGGGKRVSQ